MSSDSVMAAVFEGEFVPHAVKRLKQWQDEHIEPAPYFFTATVHVNAKRGLTLFRMHLEGIVDEACEAFVSLGGELRRSLGGAVTTGITYDGDHSVVQAMLEELDALDDPPLNEWLEPEGRGWKSVSWDRLVRSLEKEPAPAKSK